jgi:rubrerythrin
MSFYAPMVPPNMAMLMMDAHGYRKSFYKECCHRFRPFDPATSRLFEALEAEEEEQKQEIMHLIYAVLENETLEISQSYRPNYIQQVDIDTNQHYFFVIDSNMAKTILQAALQMECETYGFYEGLCTKTKHDLYLKVLFKRLSSFVENHRQILEEAVHRFYIQAPANHQQDQKKPVTLN